ncbi:hypothetical protein EDB19DRAFT_1912585 [Suillus lakei]|nr:hypothetical protein EDB19DRAFT_1912585 [Suillus lakei]
MANVTANNTWTSVVNIFGDVIFINIQNVVTFDNIYCFNINLDSSGPKKIVFHECQQITDTESETDSDTMKIETKDVEAGGNGDDMDMKVEVKFEDEDLAVISPDFQPVVASPCNLLIRHVGNPHADPDNPTAPWSYYIKKRAEVLEDQEGILVEASTFFFFLNPIYAHWSSIPYVGHY